MYTTEPFQIEGDNIILGIFGSSTFVNAKKGEGRDIRSKAIERMVQVLRSINPRLVYITPSVGVSLHLTTVLDYLRIPFIIVSPSKGHFNRFTKEHKILLSRAIGDCQTIIVVNNVKANILNLLDLEKQAEDFILERSDLILSVYGSVKTENEKKRHSKLNEIEKDVIFLNYAI
jgi:hypothetical protein|tara:strand:- start:464 stop:985 length:522 start_codon:yes stop_codon:yes gene_type:complete